MKNIETLKKGYENETAEQALERLKQVVEIIKKNESLDEILDDAEGYREYLDDFILPYSRKTKDMVTEEQIKAEEERLGIVLPVSYKKFILKYGLIKFGKNNRSERKMIFPLSDLTNENITNSWKFHIAQMKQEYGEDVMNKFSKIYVFAYGDENLERQWFHLFDFNINKETGDIPVIDFDEETKYGIIKNVDNGGVVHKNFDKYMSWIVDDMIEIIEVVKENYE